MADIHPQNERKENAYHRHLYIIQRFLSLGRVPPAIPRPGLTAVEAGSYIHIVIDDEPVIDIVAVVSVPELLEQIVDHVFDPDDVNTCEHIYSLRLVSRAFSAPITRVSLRSICIQYDLSASCPRRPSEFPDSRPTFDAGTVMSNLSLPPEDRRYVREIFFETNLEAWGWNRGFPYDGDRQYLARFVTEFQAMMGGDSPKLRLLICPGHGWDWIRLAGVTEPLESYPNLEVGWVLNFRFSIRYTGSTAFTGFFLIPIPGQDNPAIIDSPENLPPAAPRRIVFTDAHDEQDILDCIVATYPHLCAIEIHWSFLPPHPPVSQQNYLPPHALSKLHGLSWVIEGKGIGPDSNEQSIRSSPLDSPNFGSSHFMELTDFVPSRLMALVALLAQFPKQNELRDLYVQLRLDLSYRENCHTWVDDEVDPVFRRLAETVLDRFESLRVEVRICGLGDDDRAHDGSEVAQSFEALGGMFKKKLGKCGMNMVWSRSRTMSDGILPQDEREYDLRQRNPGWNLDWLSSGGPSSRGRGFPPRKLVGRAFLEGRRPFDPFHNVDGWREDMDDWGLGGGASLSL
jgi:hypothetical protein